MEYKICKRCIMDTSDSLITFDEKGYCNHCTDYFEKKKFYVFDDEEGYKKLIAIADKIKRNSKNSEYDVVVGLSGGVDSSYTALLAKKLGLRALAVHFDNGWNSEQAVRNIENIVKKLDFDYQTLVVDWEEFNDLQLSFLKASVIDVEIPTDHAFLGALYKVCKNHNIKYIFSGANYVTEKILPDNWGYKARDLKHIKAIHKKFGKLKIKTFPALGLFKEIYYKYILGLEVVTPLNYVPFNKKEVMTTLQNELGWNYYGGKHYESVFTKFFQAYILPVKFKIDKRRAHLSTLICSGQISRDEALAEISLELYPKDKLEADKEYVAKKFGLKVPELDEIIAQAPRSHLDFPNNKKLFDFMFNLYFKFTRKK